MNKCSRIVKVKNGKNIYCNQPAKIMGGWCDDCKDDYNQVTKKERWTPQNNKKLFKQLMERRRLEEAKREAEAKQVQEMLTINT